MRLLPALALLATVALVACGGEGTLSAQEYRDQLNRTCQDASAATRNLGQPTTPAGFADFLRRGVDATRPTIDRAADLNPPEDLKSAHEAYVRNARQTLDLVGRLGQRVRAAKSVQDAAMLAQQAPEASRLTALGAERTRLVMQLGASRCGQP